MQIAIIIDWDNIKRRIFDKEGFPEAFSYKSSNLQKFLCFFCSFLERNEGEKLFRIFFYTAKPYEKDLSQHFGDLDLSEEEKRKILDRSEKVSATINRFLYELGKQNYIALRLGTLSFEGWDLTKETPKPKFKQKKVDMLIGLDIAHLAYKRLVQRIILFSYDTDLQPALKVARIEGLQIVIPVLEEKFTEKPPYELLKHADIVRIRTLEDIQKHCNSQ